MKVAFDQQVFLLQEYGGISRYVCCLAQYLNQQHEVEARILAPLHFNRHLSAMEPGLSSGVRVPRIPKTFRPIARVSRALASLAISRYRPDILHETYFAAESFLPRGAKRVVTVYDMIHEKFANMFDRSLGTSDPKRIATARADHILCISESTKRDLLELFDIPEEKVSVTYLGYDLLRTPGHEANTVVSSPGMPFLLYVGNRGGYKNFDRLLQAYAQTPQLRNQLSVVCFGGGAFSAQEQGLIASLRLSLSQVRQVGGGDEILASLYQQALAFVYPSLYEGFGIPPLEAMSLGCPVICSNTSSIPEVVGNAGVYFDPADVESIAHAIVSVVDSSMQREDLVQRGREQCERFSWRRCAEDTLNVYRSLL